MLTTCIFFSCSFVSLKLKEDDKDYCSYHKYLMLKELMKEEKQKQKMIEKH